MLASLARHLDYARTVPVCLHLAQLRFAQLANCYWVHFWFVKLGAPTPKGWKLDPSREARDAHRQHGGALADIAL